MSIYLSLNIGWLYSIFIPIFFWLTIFVYRRGYRFQKEFLLQILVGLISVAGSYLMELFGIGSGLWTYFPEPWPINLWVGNFFIGLAFYQIVKLVDNFFK